MPKLIYWIFIFSIFCIAVYVRLYDIDSYASEVDDHIVAVSVIKAKDPADIQSIRTTINDTSKSTYKNFSKRYLRKLDRKGQLEYFLGIIDEVRVYFAVPNQTTYAPMQFVLTQFLIKKNQNLTQKLFWGRFPSFLVAILALLLFTRIIRKYFSYSDLDPALILALAIMAFSFEFIIYSKQMESYAIGVLGYLCLSHFLFSYIEKKQYRYAWRSFLSGILFGLLTWMQYQLLFFVIAAYGTILIHLLIAVREKPIMKLFVNLVLNFIGFLVLFCPIFILFLSKHTNHISQHWNKGENNEYFFYINQDNSILDNITYSINFFVKNSFEVFRNTIAFLPFEHTLSLIFSILFLFLFLFGTIKIFRNKSEINQIYRIFLILTALIWVILIIMGRLTLSPTRHSLILLPIFCTGIFYGYQWIIIKSAKVLTYKGIFYLLPVLIILIFSMNFDAFFSSRKELLRDERILSKFKEHKPECIITTSEILSMMPEIYNYTDVFYQSDDKSLERWISKNKHNKDYIRVALINIPFTRDSFKKSIDRMKAYGDSTSLGNINNFFVKNSIALEVRTDEFHRNFPRWNKIEVRFLEKIK